MEIRSADWRLSKEYLSLMKQEVSLMKQLRLALMENAPLSHVEKLQADLQHLAFEKTRFIERHGFEQ